MLDPLLLARFDAEAVQSPAEGDAGTRASSPQPEPFVEATIRRIRQVRRNQRRRRLTLGAVALLPVLLAGAAFGTQATALLAGVLLPGAQALGAVLSLPPVWIAAALVLFCLRTIGQALSGGWR